MHMDKFTSHLITKSLNFDIALKDSTCSDIYFYVNNSWHEIKFLYLFFVY